MTSRPTAKLSREAIITAALTFLDREGWDALTINAVATQLGIKGPRVIDDILHMLNTVTAGRTRDRAGGWGGHRGLPGRAGQVRH